MYQTRRSYWWFPLLILPLMLLCALYEGPRIEAHLQQAAEAQLSTGPFAFVRPTFSGRDAFLTGQVASGELSSEAARLVAELSGVRRVVNALEVADPFAEEAGPGEAELNIETTTPRIELRFDENRLELNGQVNGETEARLLAASSELYAEDQIVNRLERNDLLADVEGLPALLETLPELQTKLRGGSLALDPASLRLEGAVLNAEASADLETALADVAGERRLMNSLATEGVDISAEASAEVSPTTEIPEPEAEVSLAETSQDESAAATSSETENADNATTDTSQTADAEPVEASSEAFQDNTAAEPSDTTVAETQAPSEADSSEATSNTAVEGTQMDATALPQTGESSGGSSETQSSQATATTTSEMPAASRGPSYRLDISGVNVRLSGALPNQNSVQQAGAAFDANHGLSVNNALEPAEDIVQTEWLPELYTLGPRVASLLDNATLQLEGDTLTLSGNAPSSAISQAVVDDISRSLPQLRIVNDLGVAAPSTIPFSEEGK